MHKLTIQHIRNDINAAKKQLADIESQFEELNAQREAFRLKVSALETILTSSQNGQGDLLQVQTNTSQTEVEASLVETTDASASSFPVTGLRDGIRAILKEANGHGMRGRDVVSALAGRGIRMAGKTDPATRVSGELYRLHKNGQVRKRANKYYAIDTEEGG